MLQDLNQVLRTELTGSTAGGNESGQSDLIHVLSYSCFHRAGAKSPENIAAVRGVEIPPCVSDQASPRCPAATAQYPVCPEPRRGVFPVRIDDEAGVRAKDRGRPFPYVTDHLPASEHAVAGGESMHRNCSPHAGYRDLRALVREQPRPRGTGAWAAERERPALPGSAAAAISHSASVGNRRPAQ